MYHLHVHVFGHKGLNPPPLRGQPATGVSTWVLSAFALVIVLVVVVLIFGAKLRNIGQDLGGAVRGFKDGMKAKKT